MADNITTTEKRRARGLARYNQTCEVCGGRYDKTESGRSCGPGCLIPQTSVASGPYTKEDRLTRLIAASQP